MKTSDRLKRFLDESEEEYREAAYKRLKKEKIHKEKIQDNVILAQNKLEQVKNSALFYPCSGSDLFIPIEIFSPYVTDFWFVDRGYFSPGHQDTRYFGLDVAADQQAPVLEEDSRYELLSKMIKGPPVWNKDDRDITPCILTETYRHLETGREIRIHKRRGYGFSALDKEIKINELGVFFYRCDSSGEGGSGNLWLATSHINDICHKMIDGGLIVTDGSNEPERRHDRGHKELCRIRSCRPNLKTPEEFINFHQSFEDDRGRHFSCVGYAGMRCGPTMIWQVQKPVRRSWSD
jgi:hypothetical protein